MGHRSNNSDAASKFRKGYSLILLRKHRLIRRSPSSWWLAVASVGRRHGVSRHLILCLPWNHLAMADPAPRAWRGSRAASSNGRPSQAGAIQ